jgi:hypothetical protein
MGSGITMKRRFLIFLLFSLVFQLEAQEMYPSFSETGDSLQMTGTARTGNDALSPMNTGERSPRPPGDGLSDHDTMEVLYGIGFLAGSAARGFNDFIAPFRWDDLSAIRLSSFDFTAFSDLRRGSDFFSFDGFPGRNERLFMPYGVFSSFPFAGYGEVFHQASYRLSDKIRIGGNSFGVNSLLTAPFTRRGANQWEWRGASLFMQYKVSDKFRIETHVSVTGNQFQP